MDKLSKDRLLQKIQVRISIFFKTQHMLTDKMGKYLETNKEDIQRKPPGDRRYTRSDSDGGCPTNLPPDSVFLKLYHCF